MTVVAVTFDGVRFSVVDSYTDWGNYGGTGAGGSNEAPLAYQNSLASNRQQSTSGGTLGGIDYDPGSGGLNHNTSTRRLFFCKAYVTDAFDLNTSEGLRITVGSASSATFKYNLAGSTATNDAYLAYPAQGGYVLTAIDVTIAFWPITTTGSFDDTNVDYYGIQGSWVVGSAKSENIAMDAIDVGTGLYLVGGTGADPQASFVTYVEKDQDINTNRWGCVAGAGDNVNAWCMLRAGGAIEFNDTTSVVSMKDGYHSDGLIGVLHELDTAASTFDVGCTIIGEGKLYNSGAIDTRPDYVVTGTTMTALYNFSANLRNHRNVTFNSKVDCDDGDIECQLLTQDTAEIQNSTIRTNALTSIACLQDPTFGTTTGLHDTTFVQTGAGHAIEIDTAGDYTLTNLFGLSVATGGYGADTTDDAALDLTAATGTYNITIDGGDTPTYKKEAGATVNIITTVITLSVTVLDATDDTPITTAKVHLLKDSDKSVLMTGAVNGSGVLSDTISYDVDTDVVGWAREHNMAGTDYTQQDFSGEYTVNGFSIIIRLEPAE